MRTETDGPRPAHATIAHVPPLIPLRHLFDNPERAAARLSPDGRRISWVAPRDGVMNVWVRDVAGGEAVPVTHDRDRGVRSYLWSRDGARILFHRDVGGDENHHLLAVDSAGGDRERDLTPFPGVRGLLIAAPRATPRHVLVSMNRRDPSVSDAYRLTLATGRAVLVGLNPGNIIGWVVDREGLVRAARAQTPAGDFQLLVRDREDDDFRVVAEYANEDGGHPFAFTADGTRLLVGSARGSDLLRLVELDPADGSERLIDADDEADLSGPVLSDRTGELLGAVYLRDRIVMHAMDPDLARDWARVRELHPGDPHIAGQNADETAFIVAFDDDRDPGATYLYDRAGGEAELLYRSRPWLDPATLAPMRPVRIDSRDGLVLHSYLTLPLDVEPRGLPAVLVVHGGPWARDAWGYDPQVQLLANRGYAVLQVNYRGSTGFGKAFTHAAEHEFAGRMHDDLIDGVGWLVERGHRRPRPGRHLRRLVRGLRGPGRRVLHARRLRRRGQRRRSLEPGEPGALVPRLLAPVPGEHLVPVRGRSGGPRAARRHGGEVPPDTRGGHPLPAARHPGGQRPARHEGRVRPDRGGAAGPAA